MEEEVNVVRQDGGFRCVRSVLVDIGQEKKSHRGKEAWKGVGGGEGGWWEHTM